MNPSAIVLVTDHTLPEAQRIWGTGGWLHHEQREALDWLTLFRLCGWETAVARDQRLAEDFDHATPHWIVVAGDLNQLSANSTGWLKSRLANEPVLVITRAAEAGSALARLAGAGRGTERISGHLLEWCGADPARHWHCDTELDADALQLESDAQAWATLDGAPVVAARRVGRGVIVTLAYHPSAWADADGATTALLRHLLVCGIERPVAWHDLEGVLVLRMDDPGGAQNLHSRSWRHSKLDERAWAELGSVLERRNARISLGYVAGWVDDGDKKRGSLTIDGARLPRVGGAIQPTPLVHYVEHNQNGVDAVHDYQSEYFGIQALRKRGLAEVELHGFTHMHPDLDAWVAANDRYDSISWYRELGASAQAAISVQPPELHPLALGSQAMQKYFGVLPTTLICPGDEWTTEVLEYALSLGIQFVDSYYLAIRHDDRLCWAQYVCAPYIDESAPSWFRAGLPVVGYLHDQDIALHGIDWLSQCLDQWIAAGARRLVDFRELAAALSCSLAIEGVEGLERIVVRKETGPDAVGALPVLIRFPRGAVPARAVVSVRGRETMVEVEDVGGGIGRVTLAPALLRS